MKDFNSKKWKNIRKIKFKKLVENIQKIIR